MPTFYGIGRSTVDIFIPVNKIPLKFADQNLTRLSQDEMEKIYPNLEKHKANNIKKVAGGISANIVKIASYLGAKSFFTSTIGNDENGKLFERELAKYGVCAFFDKRKKTTGTFVVLHQKTPKDKYGKSVCFASPADSVDMDPIQIRTHYLSTSDCIVTEANIMEDAPLWEKLIEDCIEYKKPLLINIGALSMTEYVGQQLLDLHKKLPLIITGKATEIKLVDDFLKRHSTDLFKITEYDRSYESPLIIELGIDCESRAWFEGSCYSTSATSTNYFDEIGACDCFTGSFITRWFSIARDFHDRRKNAESIIDCLDFANEMAQKVREVYGCDIMQE